ncbi:MAG: hypothetical protein MK082_02725 [Phycisphaerales bacterium]|nr:hypothetical protein [Phycisphaerales bacterium]
MGLFWDLIQQGQISRQTDRADTLEVRVARLEDQLDEQRKLVLELLQRLESRIGEDIDGDGRVG